VKYTAALLTAAAGLALAAPPASAVDLPNFGIFRKKPKPEAAGKAKSLVATLQSDPDEKKRVQAAEELRSVDPRTNPDVVPALIGALQKDPSTAVRTEAVEAIGKLKPVSPSAAVAMETALQSEPDPKVREAIKAALWQYHLNGYRPPPTGGALATQTTEPPFSQPRAATVTPRPGGGTADSQFRPITNSVGKGVVYPPTAEPPLAKPKPPAAPKSEPRTVLPPTPSILPPPLPATAVPEPMAAKPSGPAVPSGAPMPLPTIPVPPATSPAPASAPASSGLPTIPVPPPAGKSSF
jgi:hypothetical protein